MNILDAFSGDTPQEFCPKMKDIIAYAPKNPLISVPLMSKCNEVCEKDQCIANIDPPTCTKCCEFAQTLEGEQQLAAAAYCKLWCNSNSDDNSGVCDTILTDNISIPDIIAKIVNMQAELDRVKKATDCSLDDDGNCFYKSTKSSNWTGVICVFILMALLIAVISFAMSTK